MRLSTCQLLSYIKGHPNHHIMVDEWTHTCDDTPRILEECISDMADRYLWVSWNRPVFQMWNKKIDESFIKFQEVCEKLFMIPKLSHSMRNASKIIEAAKIDMEGPLVTMPPPNFPIGIVPTYVSLSDSEDAAEVGKVIELAFNTTRKLTKEGILFLISDLDIGHIAVNLLIDVIEKACPNGIVSKYFLHPQYVSLSSGDHVRFLKKENSGVLITHDIAVEGFEWPTIISYFGGGDLDLSTATGSPCNLYMRCITNLIVIKETRENDFI